MILKGCEEGKATPKLVEVKCPNCGNELEVFVRMGGRVGVTGTLSSDETCDECGHVLEVGTSLDTLERL